MLHLTYEFIFPRTSAQYLYNICFHTYPLLLARSGDYDHYRIMAYDVSSVDFIIDNRLLFTVINNDHEDRVLHRAQINGIYSASMDFFNGYPIITEALDFSREIKIRMTFWREPAAPFWLSYEIGYIYGPTWSLKQPIRVIACDGSTWTYNWGRLSP
jgi:hypothetical protein